MAVDEAILEGVGRGAAQPTLRLYAWEPACLSLGYAQPFSDVDLEKLNGLGWEVVRRITGGRAILHTNELTYALMAPANEPRLAGDLLESYRRISDALLRAVQNLQVPAEAKAASGTVVDPTQPVCFENPSSYEIVADRKKLIGSAQARRKGRVLQHGSLPLHGDLTRITEGLAFSDEKARSAAAARLTQGATTVEAVLGKRVTWEVAAQAYVQAFEERLNLEFEAGELTRQEKMRAEELAEEKYNQAEWTQRL